SRTLIEYLLNRARSFVFTTALPPAVASAARSAVELAAGPEGDARRARLRRNVERFCSPLGVRPSHVVPIVIGDAARTMHLSDARGPAHCAPRPPPPPPPPPPLPPSPPPFPPPPPPTTSTPPGRRGDPSSHDNPRRSRPPSRLASLHADARLARRRAPRHRS